MIIPPLWYVKDPQSARSWEKGYQCRAEHQQLRRVSMVPGAAGKQGVVVNTAVWREIRKKHRSSLSDFVGEWLKNP